MRFLLVFYISVLFFSCKAQKEGKQQDLNISKIANSGEITLWFNVYDPISYALIYQNNSIEIVFYTHYLKSGKVITDKDDCTDDSILTLLQSLSFDRFKDCTTYSSFKCEGLDGSETWVQFSKNNEVILKKYWSPEDQKDTNWGLFLNDLQLHLEDGLEFSKRKDEFIGSLRRGKYWNYGSEILKVK